MVLFVAVVPLEFEGDWAEELHGVVVVAFFVEDAADLVHGDGAEASVEVRCHVMAHIVDDQQVVVECFEALFWEALDLRADLAHHHEEVHIRENSK